MKFEFAATDKVLGEYAVEVREILDVIARLADEPSFRTESFVSDLSACSDFRPSDVPSAEWCARISAEIGVEVVPGETLFVHIAERLRAHRLN